MAREAPYNRLKRIAMQWAGKVLHPHKRFMWCYEITSEKPAWTLLNLRERAHAAQQLGYHLELKAEGDNLEVYYVKNVPDIPYEFR